MTRAPAFPRSVHVVSDQTGPTQAINFGNTIARAIPTTFADCAGPASDLATLLPPAVPDVLVMSRLASPLAPDLARWARGRGVPVVFHIDDDLLDVPEWLGADKARGYRDPAYLRDLRAAMAASDLVYASTAPLAERLRSHGVEVPIVAGDLASSVEPAAIPPVLPAAGPVLGYMGSSSHAADIALVLPAIARLMDEAPSLRFELFGSIAMPGGLGRFGDRVRRHPPRRDYAGFLARLNALGWWVGIAPLVDHPFNRCKTDTKWVEYAFAGVAVVAQDLPVYHRACAGGAGRLAATTDDWARHLRALLADGAARDATVAAARRKLGTTYTHAALRDQVLRVFEAARAHAAARGRETA